MIRDVVMLHPGVYTTKMLKHVVFEGIRFINSKIPVLKKCVFRRITKGPYIYKISIVKCM